MNGRSHSTRTVLGDTLVPYVLDLRRRAGRPAFVRRGIYRRRAWNRGELLEAARVVSAWLEAQAVHPGDRVLIQSPGGPAWAAAFFGCILHRAVAVPIEADLQPAEAAQRADRTGARAGLGEGPTPPVDGLPWLRLETLQPAGSGQAARPVQESLPDDPVEIVFTSGTSGRSRAVPITHRNLLAGLHPIERGYRRRRLRVALVRPRLLCLVPPSHLFGQMVGILLPAMMGLPVIFLDDLRPRSVRAAIKRERVVAVVTVPRLLRLLKADLLREGGCLQAAAGDPLPWWRAAWRARRVHQRLGWRFLAWVSGGARLAREDERFWRDLGYLMVQGYGLTETAPVISISNPFERRTGSVGRPLSMEEIRIGDDGELWVRGDNVAAGYLDDPEATAESFHEGWLKTGDKVQRDASGRLFVQGRLKDLIVTPDGLNIDPALLENLLEQQEDVREAACVAAMGPAGEMVHAVLVLERDGATDPGVRAARAVSAANSRLPAGRRIQAWSLWPGAALPRTALGKLRRAEVRQALATSGRSPASPPDPGLDPAVAALAAVSNRPADELSGRTRLEQDLGLGSLDRLDLLVRMETMVGRTMDEAAVVSATTLEELKAAAAQPPRADLPMPRWGRRAPVRLLRSMGRALLVQPLFRTLFSLHVAGREHLDGLCPPFLLVANHESHLDTAALLLALPRRLRTRLAVAMATEHLPGLFQSPARAPLPQRIAYAVAVLLFNTYPLPRQGGFSGTLAYTGELADAGYTSLIFPEGRIHRPGEAPPHFRTGPAMLARKLRLRILPAAIIGTGACLPPGRWRPRRGRILVRFGRPFSRERVEAASDVQALTCQMERTVRRLQAAP
ncbi:MAG: AMP-binding protein [Acidobacteriota bacterium]